MPFIFRSDAGIMLISHLQRGIWEFHFPFTCILYGKCFGISVTHLTSDLEVPGSSPGVSNNFFSSFFFLFWLFNDHKIENRPPNSSPWRIQFLVRWSVNDRSPIDFVRIFFLYSFFILSLFFIFISSVHFFVHTFTRNQHGQLPSNFCQSSSPMISSQINFFKVTRSSWRHPGAIL